MKVAALHRRTQRLIQAIYLQDQSNREQRGYLGTLDADDQLGAAIGGLFTPRASELSAAHCFRLAMVAHHRPHVADPRRLGWLAFVKGHPKGGWIYAASVDRLLLKAGRPQRFATQYRLDKRAQALVLQPCESVSDQDRTSLGLEPMALVPRTVPAAARH